MAESRIQQILDCSYRNWIVGGATVLLMLGVSLPTYEYLLHVRQEKAELAAQIRQIRESLATLPALQKFESETSRLAAGKLPLIDNERALQIREEVVRLIHDLDCRLLSIKLNEPRLQPWNAGMDPLAINTTDSPAAGEFQLVSTQLNLSAEGTLSRVSQLVNRLATLHEFAVPTQMRLRQQGETNMVEIEFEVTLLNLQRNTT